MDPTPLATWLRNELQRRNMSQRQLSRAAGISVGEVSEIMHGRIPRPGIVSRLAAHFGADPVTLFEVAGIVDAAGSGEPLPPRVRSVVRRMERLNAEDQDAVLAQIEGLLAFVERSGGAPASRAPASPSAASGERPASPAQGGGARGAAQGARRRGGPSMSDSSHSQMARIPFFCRRGSARTRRTVAAIR